MSFGHYEHAETGTDVTDFTDAFKQFTYLCYTKYFIYLYVTLLFSDKYSLLGPKPMFTPHFTKLLSRRKG